MNGSKRGKGKPVYRTQKVLRGELAVGKWIVLCPWDHIYSERIFEKSAMIEAAYVGFWPYDCFAFSLSNGQPNKGKLVRIERVEKGENKVTIIAREELTEEERGCFNRWVARKGKMIYDVEDDC